MLAMGGFHYGTSTPKSRFGYPGAQATQWRNKKAHARSRERGRSWAGFEVSYAFDFGLNTKLAGTVSFPVMVTSWLCAPSVPSQSVIVYLPGARPLRVNVPFSPVTQWCGVFRTTKYFRAPVPISHFTGMISSLTEFTSCPV